MESNGEENATKQDLERFRLAEAERKRSPDLPGRAADGEFG